MFGWLRWQAAHRAIEVGFWYDVSSYALPRDATARLGGPLSEAEVTVLQRVSRRELARAFTGLRVSFTENRRAFWRVGVQRELSVARARRGPPSGAAQARPLGPFGGDATVSFLSLAQYAISLAPDGTTRDGMVAAMGRGIARAAAHELGHLITVTQGHDEHDIDSYDYPFADRASQYYGELHWGSVWPELQSRLGVTMDAPRR